MRTKVTFSIIGIISLVLIGLCIPITGSTQQKSVEDLITKDISLTHIDGNTTLNLNLTTHLGLTDADVKKLENSLYMGVLEKALASTKGVTIEILQPIDSTFHPNALVIREIITNPARDTDVRITIEERWQIKEEGWLNSQDFSEKSLLKSDRGKTPVQTDIFGIEPKNTVLVKIYNTTKSRISLKNWQIRFTYGTATGAANPRIIDRMSNANEKEWKPTKQPKTVELLYDSYSVTFSRKIDSKLLNDTTKTQNEQLAAISDGTRKIGWDIKKSPNLFQWIEIHDIDGQLKHLNKPLILFVPNESSSGEDFPNIDRRIIIKPSK